MRAAILTIGDELTSGYRLDTNAQHLARHLTALPVDVVLHLSVPDELCAIHDAIDVALEAADILVMTGGLGPTEDDLTRGAVAEHFGQDLVEDQEALKRVRARFATRGLSMPEGNRNQALVPATSEIIQNDRGTASGFYLTVDERHLFAMPGVPYEMRGMLKDSVLPRLQQLIGGSGPCVARALVKVYGIPESEISERIAPMLARDRNPLLGLLPDRGTITIEMVAEGALPRNAGDLIEVDRRRLRGEFGSCIVSEDERDLPDVVGDLLLESGFTVAVAELGTRGLVAARLTESPSEAMWFWGGTVLRVTEGSHGRPLALSLARKQAMRADIGLGVSEIAPKSGEDPSIAPHGQLHVALSQGERAEAWSLRINGDRLRVREMAADATLNLLRLWMLGEASGTG